MSDAAIEAPYTVASVPRPLYATHGRTQASLVCGIRESKKRKRHEVAIGVDGEGVNIYNVQSQRLVASYAIPPQTYLCCPPCSIYFRATASLPAQRRTYAVVKDGANDRKRRLICFTEQIRSTSAADGDFTVPERAECRLDEGDIISLDAIPPAEPGSLHVAVIYATGDIFIASADLARVETLGRPQLEGLNSYVVEYSTTLDTDTARKGLLKNREDITSQLDQYTLDSALLCYILRVDHERHLYLYSIKAQMLDSLQTSRPGLQLLMSYSLPAPRKQSSNAATHELHVATGRLHQLLDGKLSIFDLTSTVPKLSAEFGSKSLPLCGFARVSPSLILTVSKASATLYETKYSSTYGSVALSSSVSSGEQGKKRKREDLDEQVTCITTLFSFSEFSLVVGMRGHELVALQLSDAIRGNKRAKSNGILLADIFCKSGLKSQIVEKSEKKRQRWKDWTDKVDSLIDMDDVKGLEKLVVNDLTLRKHPDHKVQDHLDKMNGPPNGGSISDDLRPSLYPIDPANVDQRKALYILGSMFVGGDAEDAQLGLRIVSTKLMEWFALVGLLSVYHVRKSWSETRPNIGGSNTLIPGDIMKAIRQVDETFEITYALLSLSVLWEIEEVIQALRLIVQSFEASDADEPLLALSAPQQPNGDVVMANGDVDSEVELESRAAKQELDHAISTLKSGLEIRSHNLRVIFARLHAFDSAIVKTKLRAILSHQELIFFIHVLRIELADGWTSQYVGPGANESEEEGAVNAINGSEDDGPSNEAIRTIGDLLNCAVDAIGTSGWLVGRSNAALGTNELLDSLRAEVSAGFEGCLEANTLESLLKELDKFAPSVEKNEPEMRRRVEEQTMEGDGLKAILPMGRRVEAPVLKETNSLDARKSMIAMAQEKSRSVGMYSFDTIRI